MGCKVTRNFTRVRKPSRERIEQPFLHTHTKRLENSGGNGGERAWREEKEKEFNLRRRGAGCANRWNLRKCETRAEDRGCFHLMHTYTPRSQHTYRFLNFLNTFVRKNKMDKKKKLCC